MISDYWSRCCIFRRLCLFGLLDDNFSSSLLFGRNGDKLVLLHRKRKLLRQRPFSACFFSLVFFGRVDCPFCLFFGGSGDGFTPLWKVLIVPPSKFGANGVTSRISSGMSTSLEYPLGCLHLRSAFCASLINLSRSPGSPASFAFSIASCCFCGSSCCTVFSRRRLRCMSFFRSFSSCTSLRCTSSRAAGS